jgi:transcriptional regulator with XRE-family HTH domain
MVLNNIEIETKVKCLEAGITQEQLGVKVGTTGQYVNRIIKKKDGLINKTFVGMMESLGYDIQLTYVPKKED